MAKNYLPQTDPERVTWFNNFASKLPVHATVLGLTGAEVKAVQDDAAMVDHLIGKRLPALRTAQQQQTAYKNLIVDGPLGTSVSDPPALPTLTAAPNAVAPGVLPRVRSLVQRIKNTASYTDVIGADLGIVGAETPTGDTPKPTFKAVALPGHEVRLDWVKGRLDGVTIQGRKPGEAAWTDLGVDHYSPFVDTRKPADPTHPEIREYRMRYLSRDEPTGDWSNVATVSTLT
jgi:hypothetical protein